MTRYFLSRGYHPPAVLRRENYVDHAFVAGRWVPTGSVVDWSFGEDDTVEEISEDEARTIDPKAFTVTPPVALPVT